MKPARAIPGRLAARRSRSDPGLRELPFYLARVYHGFRGLVERQLADAGLQQHVRPGMGSIFFALCEEEDCQVKRLAERLRVPNGTLTGLLDGLEKAGVIQRHACPDDGRAFRVRLTKFGRSLETALRSRHAKITGLLQNGLSNAEVEELKRLLNRVLENMWADAEEERAARRRGAKSLKR